VKEPFIGGAYAGLGNGWFITNATTGKDMLGPFENFNINLGFGPGISLTFSKGDNGVWAFSMTSRLPSYGISFSSYPTATYGLTNH
jgi:hypothetical protein